MKIQCLGNGANVHNNVCVSCQEIHSGGHLDGMEADWSKPIVSMRYLGNSLFYHFPQRFQPKEEVLVAGSIFLSLLFGLQGYFPFGWKV